MFFMPHGYHSRAERPPPAICCGPVENHLQYQILMERQQDAGRERAMTLNVR
jgi:hypothetical protein